MDRIQLKDKYNSYYKEFKRKEWYQLSQFDKLFILLLELGADLNTLIAKQPVPTTVSNTENNTLVSKDLEIKFDNGFCSNNFTLPSADCLIINPIIDKDVTVSLQLAYKDTFVETGMFIDIPKNTQLVTTDFSKYKGIVNRKDSCRLCCNEVLSATFLMYYV